MATVYGYARCSTDESRQDINRQRRDLKGLGVTDETNIYWEYESGTKVDRPELQKLLAAVKPGDTIVATEVSRLTRSTKQLEDMIEFVNERHLKLIVGAMVIDCTGEDIDPMTEAMLKMCGVFAELERKMISQRVKSGLKNARAKGKTLGRPKVTAEEIPSKFWKHLDQYKAGRLTKTEYADLLNVSRPTIYKWLRVAEAEELKEA